MSPRLRTTRKSAELFKNSTCLRHAGGNVRHCSFHPKPILPAQLEVLAALYQSYDLGWVQRRTGYELEQKTLRASIDTGDAKLLGGDAQPMGLQQDFGRVGQ